MEGHLLVEVWRWQKWCGPFVWIGTNALTVYLAVNLVEFNAIAARFVGGDLKRMMDAQLAKGAGELLVAIVGLFLSVLLARFLYQRNVFIRL